MNQLHEAINTVDYNSCFSWIIPIHKQLGKAEGEVCLWLTASCTLSGCTRRCPADRRRALSPKRNLPKQGEVLRTFHRPASSFDDCSTTEILRSLANSFIKRLLFSCSTKWLLSRKSEVHHKSSSCDNILRQQAIILFNIIKPTTKRPILMTKKISGGINTAKVQDWWYFYRVFLRSRYHAL
jgi:hypothetical protein